MPEEYGEHDLAVPGDKDEASGANVPESFRHFTDSLDPLIPPISGAGDGKLVIVQSGAPAYKALSGDATLNAAGALTLADGAVKSSKIKDGAVGTTQLADGAVTSSKLKPTAYVAYGPNKDVAYTTQDWVTIPGMSYEFTVPAASYITAHFTAFIFSLAGHAWNGGLALDGGIVGAILRPEISFGVTVCGSWQLPVTEAGTYKIEMQQKHEGGALEGAEEPSGLWPATQGYGYATLSGILFAV